MSHNEARVRQYEDDNLSPAELASFEVYGESRLSGQDFSSPPLPPHHPTDVIVGIIHHLLEARSDAALILSATAARLGLPQQSLPGPASVPALNSGPPVATSSDLTDSFALWRDFARSRRRLDSLLLRA